MHFIVIGAFIFVAVASVRLIPVRAMAALDEPVVVRHVFRAMRGRGKVIFEIVLPVVLVTAIASRLVEFRALDNVLSMPMAAVFKPLVSCMSNAIYLAVSLESLKLRPLPDAAPPDDFRPD